MTPASTQALALAGACSHSGLRADLHPTPKLRIVPKPDFGARRNGLLDCLPEAVWQRWQPHLAAIDLPLGNVLCEPGERLTHVIFPTTAIVSQLYLTENGSAAEIAVVGPEGMVGTWLPMGGGTTLSRHVVQTAGRGLWLSASVLLQDFDRSEAVMHLLLRYTQALLTQTAQMAVCNRYHSIEQRLCRWLLLRLDRLDSKHIPVTQELMAGLLGVRREGITEAAGHLQRAGLITYHRGRIEVLKRQGLEARSCECHGVVKKEYDRLLPAQVAR